MGLGSLACVGLEILAPAATMRACRGGWILEGERVAIKAKLSWLIFVGILAGAVFGVLVSRYVAAGTQESIIAVLDLFGTTVFVGALKMIVAPLIFFSILSAITRLPTTGQLWRIGWKTLVFYLATTSIAVAIGLLLVLTVRPGHTPQREEIRDNWQAKRSALQAEYGQVEAQIEEAQGKSALTIVRQTLTEVIRNPFAALAESSSLSIILFAILLGVALIVVGPPGRAVLPVIEGINEAIMCIAGWIMVASPFFIFCLVAALVASLGLSVLQTLSWYMTVVIAGIAVHVVVLLGICWAIGGIRPLRFLRGIREAWMMAFATRSSLATLPVTLNCVTDKLGVSEKAAEFVLPLGATINMDGTALYEGVAVIFLIQLFGQMPGAEITLTPALTVVVFLTAVLASIGAAAVPNAGLITMVLVANAVGLDADYALMIFAVDAFLDMFRTSTNVMGDSVGAVVINRLEGRLLESSSPEAGGG